MIKQTRLNIFGIVSIEGFCGDVSNAIKFMIHCCVSDENGTYEILLYFSMAVSKRKLS